MVYLIVPADGDVTVTPVLAVVLAIVELITEVISVLPLQRVSAVVFVSPHALITNVFPEHAELSTLPKVIEPSLNVPVPVAFANEAAGVTVIALSQAVA